VRIVVALGGNARLRRGEPPEAEKPNSKRTNDTQHRRRQPTSSKRNQSACLEEVSVMRLSSLGHPAFPSWAEKAARERRAALIAIKAVHTLAFFAIGSCLGYLTYSGLTKRSDRRAAIACEVVAGRGADLCGERLALSSHRPCRRTRRRSRLGCGHLPAPVGRGPPAADHDPDLRSRGVPAREKHPEGARSGSRTQ